MKSSKEVHLDVILTPIVDLNALEQIIDLGPFHSGAPFFSPLAMPSLDFENMHPPRFTPIRPTPSVLSFCRLPGWHCIALLLSCPSMAKEKVDSKKWT